MEAEAVRESNWRKAVAVEQAAQMNVIRLTLQVRAEYLRNWGREPSPEEVATQIGLVR